MRSQRNPAFHGCIRQRPEVDKHLCWLGRIHPLSEQNADRFAGRVDVGGRPKTARPPESAGVMKDLASLNIDRYSHAPTRKIPKKYLRAGALLRSNLIGLEC